MVVKNIFEKDVFEETQTRILALLPESQPLWGKMTVSQMLAHLSAMADVITADAPPPRMFAGRLVGWALKGKLTDDKPMPKNLPTAPSFLIKEDKNLDLERNQLLQQLQLLKAKGEQGVHNIAHPFFGKLSGKEWGMGTWKHFDHHLKQFGV